MDYVRFHAQLHPQRPAVGDLTFDRHWNYAEFDNLVSSCVALLLEEKVDSGDRVSCLSKNRAEIIVLHLACARLGAIFVPMNWRLSEKELQLLVEDSEPAVLYGEDLGLSFGLAIKDINYLFEQCIRVSPDLRQNSSLDMPSLMLYTSGTTGKPKGVLLSERNLNETGINFTSLGEVDSKSCFLCESPMFHVIGMVTSIRPPLLCGGQILISDAFIPERTLSRLATSELKISHYFCVPQMALSLRGVENFNPDSLRNLKAIFTGGAPHPEPQIRAWLADGISIVDGFGMTETGTVFGMPLDYSLIDQKAGCVGISTPRVQVRLVDSLNEIVGIGKEGELQIKGDNITCGYWRREEAFQEALTEDGWFRTGDVFTVDKEGYFQIKDRIKDMYISGGENVYPAEVESKLINYPNVCELSVVGVPDKKWGEVGCVFYVIEPRAMIAEISPEEIYEFLNEQIARYKIPKKTFALDKLPRNALGKVLKHELLQMLEI